MRTTDELMALVLAQSKKRRRKRESRALASLSAASVMLFFCLVGLGGIYGGGHRGTVPGLYGSTLLYEGAGGYVLVGVVAFAVAVVITVLCIRYRNKQKGNKTETEDDEQ